MSPALDRYLEKRALNGPWQMTGSKRSDYSAAVVIPACDEERWLFRTLDSLAANRPESLQDVLVLVVINQPTDANRNVKIANRRTLEQFTASPLRKTLQLGWIDACSEGRELQPGGVGSARKLGFDLALSRLGSDPEPLLISLDADTLVEPGYLDAITTHFRKTGADAAVIPFRHQPADSAAAQKAIDQYELYLRCYLLGLTVAGSPYAFHTIGSAIACRRSAYIRCGGMNRRSGGEDFYFLQSLAKTGEVNQVSGTTVHPAARLSSRVPFGTGPALIRLVDNPDDAFFFPLQLFDLLGRWLDTVAASRDIDGPELQQRATALDPALGSFMHRQKLAATWERLCSNHPTDEKRLHAFHTWFDGLRTQQLLKHLAGTSGPGFLSAADAVPEFLHRAGLDATGLLADNLETLRRHQNFPPFAGK